MRDLVDASYLKSLSVDQILGWIESAASEPAVKRWVKELPDLLDRSVRGSRYSLDRFVDGLAAFPRGVVCHWLSGNVPLLGAISVLQALVTKNASIVKLPSHDRHFLPALLDEMRGVSTDVDGERILASVATQAMERDDPRQRDLSLAADVRVAWGGAEAIDHVSCLPKRPYAEDLFFGPRTSFAIVGKERASDSVAHRAAVDLQQLEQRGCNSPHTLFVERGGERSPREFAERVAAAMRGAPSIEVAAGRTGELLALRADYKIKGAAFCPDDMGWSVLYSEEEGLADPVYHRTLFVRSFDDLLDLVNLCSRQTQTVGLALAPERSSELAYRLMGRGVDRCPPVGEMALYATPWDGLFPLDRLVRYAVNVVS